jgi:hypothetical protein
MPQQYEKCVKDGGRVITKQLAGGKYIHICYLGDKSYAGEVKEKKMSEQEKKSAIFTMMVPLLAKFAEEDKSEIQILKPGKWDHPSYGEVEITNNVQKEFADNFKRDLRAHSSTVGLPIDEEHRSSEGAVGWIKKLINRDQEGLFAIVEWNTKGRQLIKDAIYRFFSPEFYFQYEDPETRRVYNNVLAGGALTNRPYFKGLSPVVLSEQNLINKNNKHMPTLKEVCQKALAEFNDEEKALVIEKFSELDEEMQKKFAELKPKEENKEKDKGQKNDGAGAVKASEEFKMSEAEAKQLKEQAAEGVRAMAEVKKMRTNEKVSGFIYSESNKTGKLPATLKDKVVNFVLTLSEEQTKAFDEIIGGLPSAQIFAEIGDAAFSDNKTSAPAGVDEDSFALDQKAKEVMKANDKLTYEQALVMAEKELAKK